MAEKNSHTFRSRLIQYSLAAVIAWQQPYIAFQLNRYFELDLCPSHADKCRIIDSPLGQSLYIERKDTGAVSVPIDNGLVGNQPVHVVVKDLSPDQSSSVGIINNSLTRVTAVLGLSYLFRKKRSEYSKKQQKNPELPFLDTVRTALLSYLASAGTLPFFLSSAFELTNLFVAKQLYLADREYALMSESPSNKRNSRKSRAKQKSVNLFPENSRRTINRPYSDLTAEGELKDLEEFILKRMTTLQQRGKSHLNAKYIALQEVKDQLSKIYRFPLEEADKYGASPKLQKALDNIFFTVNTATDRALNESLAENLLPTVTTIDEALDKPTTIQPILTSRELNNHIIANSENAWETISGLPDGEE